MDANYSSTDPFYAERIAALKAEVERLQRMLYTMTSLRDWQLAGYDSAEYDALYEKFEGKESDGE